jgi:hypothetical protein
MRVWCSLMNFFISFVLSFIHSSGHVGQVRALPTVVAFRDGEPVKQFVGALAEGGVRKFLEEV